MARDRDATGLGPGGRVRKRPVKAADPAVSRQFGIFFWDYSERGGRVGRAPKPPGLRPSPDAYALDAGAEARGVTIARMNPNPITPADTVQSRSV